MDCYLKLLVRLCHIYDTRGGVKKVKDGASQDQIMNETRLHGLQKQLIKDLSQANDSLRHFVDEENIFLSQSFHLVP